MRSVPDTLGFIQGHVKTGRGQAPGHRSVPNKRPNSRKETDAKLFVDLVAWDGVQLYVSEYRRGNFDPEDARQCVGQENADAFYNAVQAIAELFPLFIDANSTEGTADAK